MTITRDRQVELQGVLMGPGTSYAFRRFAPWLYPQLDTGRTNRSGRHGVQAGRDLMRTRRVPMEISIVANGKDAVLAARHTLVGAFAPTDVDVPLTFRAGSTTYRIMGRPVLADTDAIKAPAGVADVVARFEATDPIIYANTLLTVTTGFPSAGAGVEFGSSGATGVEFGSAGATGVEFGPAGVAGSVLVDNEGTVEVPWQASITGPWVDPIIERVGTNERLSLGISVPAGERLLIDSADRSIWLGSSFRGGVVLPGSTWPRLTPGVSQIRVRGDSGSGQATISWRSGWV